VSLHMLTNLRLADLRLTTAQQRSTGQNLPFYLYYMFRHIAAIIKYIVVLNHPSFCMLYFPTLVSV
jgi:hypothetical protein